MPINHTSVITSKIHSKITKERQLQKVKQENNKKKYLKKN